MFSEWTIKMDHHECTTGGGGRVHENFMYDIKTPKHVFPPFFVLLTRLTMEE
jgi:hypothetical protein